MNTLYWGGGGTLAHSDPGTRRSMEKLLERSR